MDILTVPFFVTIWLFENVKLVKLFDNAIMIPLLQLPGKVYRA